MISRPPNILFITTDQQRFDTIGAAGNPSIFTPHLDWLCDTGIRFSRCYSDCPVCVPARTTIMTGQFAYNHGRTANQGGRLPIDPSSSLPGRLTASGYQTKAVGKMHFTPERSHFGFESMDLLGDYYREAKKRGWNPMDHGVGQNELTPVISTVDEKESLTRWTVQRSIDFLETRDTDRPFFLWTSFSKPHPPLDPPLNYWTLYDGISIPEPVIGDWCNSATEAPQGFYGPTRALGGADRLSREQILSARRAYYACITQIDYSLGLLFARLREMDLMGDTWIVFTADHGEMIGDHHMGSKSVFLEGSAHVPLLVKPPQDGALETGYVDDRLACLADVAPTLHQIAGLEPIASMDGQALIESDVEPRTALAGQFGGKMCCYIEGYWKYLYAAPGAQELLFNLEEDPMEERDLAESEEHTGRKEEMKSALISALEAGEHGMTKDGCLITSDSVLPATEKGSRTGSWPGFHSLSTDPRDGWGDVLH